jgi:hypothetical protein
MSATMRAACAASTGVKYSSGTSAFTSSITAHIARANSRRSTLCTRTRGRICGRGVRTGWR